jgi:hypothetical protein
MFIVGKFLQERKTLQRLRAYPKSPLSLRERARVRAFLIDFWVLG